MKSEEEVVSPSQRRVLDVIVITDNREHPHQDRAHPHDKSHADFRSSAFKETEVDPLQFQKNQFNDTHDDDLIAQLNKRIADLQNRVQALESREGVQSQPSRADQGAKRRKVRRKNSQLKRDRTCPHCGKNYGTDTALKYHIKLKHTPLEEHH